MVSPLTGPKYQNIIAKVEATELGFLLETFNQPSSLSFRSHKRREPRYLMSVPQKTDFQLPDPTPSIPTCLFWIPTGPSQQHKQRAPPVSNGALSFRRFTRLISNCPENASVRCRSHPFLEGPVQEQARGRGGGPPALQGVGAFKINCAFC